MVGKMVNNISSDLSRRTDFARGRDLSWQPKSYDFCGARFDPLTAEETEAQCASITPRDQFRYIVTPNVDHLVRLSRDAKTYDPLYRGAWLSVCDSRILEILAQISGVPLRAVPGSDLTKSLFDHHIHSGEAVNVIGGDDDVIAAVAAKYNLTNLNHHQPPMGLRSNPAAVQECAKFISANPARFTFICVGSPQQEMVAQAAQAIGGARGLGLCVGASLDFLAGKVRRAPLWMQRLRMEWLFRLLSEPKRLWRRYLLDGPSIFLIWLKWIVRGNKHSQGGH